MMEDSGSFQQNKSMPSLRRGRQEGRGGQRAAKPKAVCLGLRGVIYVRPNKLNKLLKVTESKYNLNPENIEKI